MCTQRVFLKKRVKKVHVYLFYMFVALNVRQNLHTSTLLLLVYVQIHWIRLHSVKKQQKLILLQHSKKYHDP